MMDLYKQAQAKMPTSLPISPPSKWLGLYEDFVKKNSSSVSQIEAGLRSLTYIIPGRFRDSEVASETIYSGVQLLSMYHDSLLSRAFASFPPSLRPHPTPHNRYTKFWTSRSPLYHRLALSLQMLQNTELLWEMIARRRGEKTRWRIVILLEFLKAICRLLLLRLTNSRPLVSPPLPERETPNLPPESFDDISHWDGISSPPSEASLDLSWTMPRTGLSLPILPSTDSISSYLISRVLTPDDVKAPKTLLHRVSGAGQFAEILYILRPLIYALALRHFSTRTASNPNAKRAFSSSWTPWLLGLGLEYGSRQLAKKDFRERVAGGLRGLTLLEREELRKRGYALAWWAMRGAFYENVTRRWIKGFVAPLKGKPLLDLVAGVVEDYEYLWERYYFSTATM